MSAISELIPCTNNKNGNFEFIQKFSNATVMISNRIFWNPDKLDDDTILEIGQYRFTIIVESYNGELFVGSVTLPEFNTDLVDYTDLIQADPYSTCDVDNIWHRACIVMISSKATLNGESEMFNIAPVNM
jgi:hypothetical protein